MSLRLDPEFAAQAMNTIRGALGRAFMPCKTPGCQAFSLGVVCVKCSRPCCTTHGFVQASIKPKFLCVSCIIDENEHLLEVVDVEEGQP